MTFLLVTLGLIGAGAADGEQDRLDFFESRIRPLLVERCYSCHSRDAKKLRAGLRLDDREGLLAGGDSGPALVPGDPEKSLIIRAVRYEDPDLSMPPQGKLAPAEIAALERWVAMGAPDPRSRAGREEKALAAGGDAVDVAARKAAHWAWRPIAAHVPPQLMRRDWPRAAADRWVAARLEAAGLEPAAEAGRLAWLRRATYALTGLPPSIDEIAAFAGDSSPLAFESAADRLLASPAFGERWGVHWLDLVRYAETCGHEQDFAIAWAHRYRDHVIRTMNADVPYDDIIVEHVAGDLIEKPRLDPVLRTDESIQGTGFWHLGEATHSPVDIRGDEADRVANQIDVFSRAFLGLTLACARCHDHKFDAMTTQDYYAVFGYLQSSSFQVADASDPEAQERTYSRLESLRADYEPRILGAAARDIASRIKYSALEVAAAAGGQPQPGVSAAAAQAESPSSRIVVDYSHPGPEDWIASGWRFGGGPLRPGDVVLGNSAERPIARVLDCGAAAVARASPRFSGFLRTRTFEVTAPKLWYRFRGKAEVFLSVDSHRVVEGPLHAVVRQKLDGGADTRWQAHDVHDYIGHRVHVELRPLGDDFALERVELAEAEPPAASSDQGPPSAFEVREALAALGAGRLAEEARAAVMARRINWVLERPDLLEEPRVGAARSDSAARSEIAALLSRWEAERSVIEKDIPAPYEVLALLDGSGENEPVHIRGNHRTLAEKPVGRRFLAALSGSTADAPPTSRGSGRLDLARRMVSHSDPLLHRVFVNRVWHHLFGRGIVPTVDDFGVMGQPPSHPQLLDDLALEFRRDGASLKGLVRRLVLSSVYRMSSRGSPAADAADPQNILLHRWTVRRLEAEPLRDGLLAMSGRLDRAMFGQSVRVHVPPHLLSQRGPPALGPLDGAGRRSIYLEVRRNFLPQLLVTFDRPIPATTMGRRSVSNSPAQPLALLNDPFVHEQAALWGRSLAAREGAEPEALIAEVFLAAFGRPATAHEVEMSLAFLRERLSGDGADAAQAWADLCHSLTNVKELTFLE